MRDSPTSTSERPRAARDPAQVLLGHGHLEVERAQVDDVHERHPRRRLHPLDDALVLDRAAGGREERDGLLDGARALDGRDLLGTESEEAESGAEVEVELESESEPAAE